MKRKRWRSLVGTVAEKVSDEVVELACKLKAPVGYSFRGKQWLEHENPNAVGMTGLMGYGERTTQSMKPTSCSCWARIFRSPNFFPAPV